MIPRFLMLIVGLLLAGCHDSATSSKPQQSPVSALGAADTAAFRLYRARLTQLGSADQQDREVFMSLLRQYGLNSMQFDTAKGWLWRQDSVRLHEFLALEKHYGWPRKSQVGSEGVVYAYLLIQHAPEQVQVSFQNKIQASYERGELPGSDYATYLDRLLGYQNRPQRYGTQYARRVLPDGREESYLLPVEDFTRVDQRRATVQLEPLLSQLVPGTLVFKPGMK